MLICWNYVKIIVDLTEILSSWLEIENLRNGQLGSLNYFVVLQLEFAKPNYWS
jgi:hypothetical protein